MIEADLLQACGTEDRIRRLARSERDLNDTLETALGPDPIGSRLTESGDADELRSVRLFGLLLNGLL